RLANPITEACQGRLQLPLDRPGSRLDLETGKVRSVIFDPGSEAACRVGLGDVLSGASIGVQLDKLDLHDRRGVAPPWPDLDDPGVARRPVGIFRRDLVEQLRD